MARTEDGGRLSGAIDGDRWRFELEEEITSSVLLLPPSLLLSFPLSLLPSPFWSFNFGSYCHARSLVVAAAAAVRFVVVRLEILGRPARRGAARTICRIWSSYIIRYDTRFRAEQF